MAAKARSTVSEDAAPAEQGSRTALVVANPAAGGGSRTDGLRGALGAFAEAGWTVQLKRTQRLGHARELAREAAENGVDAVIAAGGDGTVNEITNGLAGTETAMGVIPAGTGNVMAAQLGLIGTPTPLHRADFVTAAQAVARSPVRRVDLGFAQPRNGEGRHFLLWVGVGFDAAVTHEIEGPSRDLKRLLGPAAFGAVGVRSAVTTSGVESLIRADDDKVRGALLWGVVANVPLYAGAVTLSHDVYIDDGRLDLIMLFGDGVVSSAIGALGSLLGLPGDQVPEVTKHERIRIVTAEPLPVHLDAEPFGTTPMTITSKQGALRLLVPDSTPKGLFRESGDSAL